MAGPVRFIGPRTRWTLLFCVLTGLVLVSPFRASPRFPDPHTDLLVCEPRTALDFGVTLVEFEPAAGGGGIARIRISMTPRAEMGMITVSGRLRQGLRFSDGSTERAWQFTLPTNADQSFTEEIQIPSNGLHVIALEASALLSNGRPVHRGEGVKVYAGMEPPAPRKRGQVLEFQGEVAEEPLP